jgi:hypothetical protein
VTSDLAREFHKADHCQGESGPRTTRYKARKFFEIKILTSHPSALNILQTIFANPAPVKAFKGVGGGGIPRKQGFPKMKLAKVAVK